MAQDSTQEMAVFILDKFRYPNADMRYFGGSSTHMHLMRDVMETLKSLGRTRDQSKRQGLFEELRGQVLALRAVEYYSDKEVEEILTKIDKAEES